MKSKKMYSLWMMAAIVAMSFTACSENVEPEKTTLEHSKMTCFGSGEVVTPAVVASVDGSNDGPSFLNGLQKIAMAANGKFSWVEGDTVWVNKDGEWVSSVDMQIKTDDNWADFYFDGGYYDETYEVRYTGTSGDPNVVTITSEQVQKKANNSEHYAACGDAAWGIAKKLGDLKYRFNFRTGKINSTDEDEYQGNHEASYIYFEPRTNVAPATEYCRVRKVKITEFQNKNICGTYNFNKEGENYQKLNDETRTSNGGNVITVYCGEDVQKVDNGELSPAVAQNNGFPIKEVRDPDKNRAFMVLQPGNYKLKIEYEVALYLEQKTTHGTQWTPSYEEKITTIEKTYDITCEPNTYYYMRHRLDITDSPTQLVFPFKEYYMWGATDWFWKGAENLGIPYPVHNDEYQTDGAPTEDQKHSNSWFYNSYQVNKICVWSFNGDNTHMYINRTQDAKDRLKAVLKDGMRRDQPAEKIWKDSVLNANEMSFYVVFGDPYYDNKTPWILEEYNGGGTVCYGGVWLLKKEKIISGPLADYNADKSEDLQVHWPKHDDSSPNDVESLSAPYPTDALDHFDVDEDTKKFIELKMMGQQYNLRYMAPPFNFRKRYSNDGRMATVWRPDQDGKKLDDYFFVPCLGRFEYDNEQTAVKTTVKYPIAYSDQVREETTEEMLIEGTGEPTLTLVGSQGYYWTRTPLMFNYFGNSNTSGNDQNEQYGTRFYKYTYDHNGNLTSTNSNLDYYNFNYADYQRYWELKEKGSSRTAAEEEEYQDLIKGKKDGFLNFAPGLSKNAIRNVFRFANYGTWNDNAYYLNIHHDYLALSWQQHSIYVKTGMRRATTGKNGIFK